MAKGYNQEEGINFIDTFSLVVKIVTVNVLLTLSTSFIGTCLKRSMSFPILATNLLLLLLLRGSL